VDVFARRDAVGTNEIFAHDGFGGKVAVRIWDFGSVNLIHRSTWMSCCFGDQLWRKFTTLVPPVVLWPLLPFPTNPGGRLTLTRPMP
jgi:hypothetical protein